MTYTPRYYIPHQSAWPIIGSIALFLTAFGAAGLIQQSSGKFEVEQGIAPIIFFTGVAMVVFMMFGWFGIVIKESLKGLVSGLLDRSYRLAMLWFIVSEVMFFAVFFGALFYARIISVPWLAGAGNNLETHLFLWPDFADTWPLFITPDGNINEVMQAWGLPLINTMILVSSSITVTFAHWALKNQRQIALLIWLAITVLLGVVFLTLQVVEYQHAFNQLGLSLGAGIYGSTFFMLTGFHGFHVTMGTVMLAIIWVRCIKHHFSPEKHFAFEACCWYWHFVDVVWLFLFTFVYWF